MVGPAVPKISMLLIAVCLAVAVGVLYGVRLDYSPPYLYYDEIFFGLHAHAIATSGHDLNGNWLPLFFYTLPGYWAEPIIIYATAAVLTLVPLSETVVRAPSVGVGIINVLLVCAIAKRIFGSNPFALVAAVLLALTPAHFLHSRLAMDYVYPPLFTSAWFLCLLVYLDTGRLSLLFLGTLSLGIGCYSYVGALVMMPLYWLVTGLVLAWSRPRAPSAYLVAAAGFLLPLIPMAIWLAHHPGVYAGYIERYGIYDAKQLGVAEGVSELFGFERMKRYLSVYYGFFNPSFLLFEGGSNIMNATRRAGVFPFAFAILLPLGLWHILTSRPTTAAGRIQALGLATAPAAITLVGESTAIYRGLEVLIFGALIAASGVQYLVSRGTRGRIVALCLVALVPIQFSSFLANYFTDYRVLSSLWFQGNIRGAMEEIAAGDYDRRVSSVWLSQGIPYGDFYWKFYAAKLHRPDLVARTTYFDPSTVDVSTVPAGSVILSRAGGAEERFLQSGRFRKVAVAVEPDGQATFVVMRTLD
jgi:4-amino-4-deoxy-L-arabinose transferase-like glycosyltransferase